MKKLFIFMYFIPKCGDFMGNRLGIDAYTQLLCQTINPNSIVFDIGTGSFISAQGI